MSTFEKSIESIFHHEGGLSTNKNDKGGTTNLGISLRFLKTLPLEAGDINNDGHISEKDILDMSAYNAKGLYKQFFWNHYHVGKIRDQRVATKMFNCYVNMRGKTASLILQRACNDLQAGIVEDGIAGNKTFSAVNRLDPDALVTCIKWRMWELYKKIIKNDPSQKVFSNGWRNRAFSDV